jgi:hypothetical protein
LVERGTFVPLGWVQIPVSPTMLKFGMAELADAVDSKSISKFLSVGSSPTATLIYLY